MGRREFLQRALISGSLAAYPLGRYAGFLPTVPFDQPDQLSASSSIPKGLLTPNLDFFIRNHFSTPKINEDAWQLEVSGLVSKPLKLSYSDLLLMTSVNRPSTLECAGNVSGGAGVSTAAWSGVPLGDLLQQAGVQKGASTVVFHGADSGEGEGISPGTHFARAIPIEKATDTATLLAYEMNGEPLPAERELR